MIRYSSRRTLGTAAWAGLLGASLLLAACSSGGDSSPATEVASGSTEPVEVTVALSEFAVTSSQTEFQQGVPYRFVVTNNGTIAHELMLIPPMAMGGMSMEEMDAMALTLIEESELGPGETRTMEYTFDRPYGADALELACYITGHYDAGMHLAVQVGD
jgi:uncharacterized cupredoxin-like copper-binding protein